MNNKVPHAMRMTEDVAGRGLEERIAGRSGMTLRICDDITPASGTWTGFSRNKKLVKFGKASREAGQRCCYRCSNKCMKNSTHCSRHMMT